MHQSKSKSSMKGEQLFRGKEKGQGQPSILLGCLNQASAIQKHIWKLYEWTAEVSKSIDFEIRFQITKTDSIQVSSDRLFSIAFSLAPGYKPLCNSTHGLSALWRDLDPEQRMEKDAQE